jgi:hypothetical protein
MINAIDNYLVRACKQPAFWEICNGARCLDLEILITLSKVLQCVSLQKEMDRPKLLL